MFGINYKIEKGLEVLLAEVRQDEVCLFPNYTVKEEVIFSSDDFISDAFARMKGVKVTDPVAADLLKRQPGQVVLRKGPLYYCIEARQLEVLGGCPC